MQAQTCKNKTFTFLVQGKHFSRRHFKIFSSFFFFFFFLENRWQFVWIIKAYFLCVCVCEGGRGGGGGGGGAGEGKENKYHQFVACWISPESGND